jgi:hypothetical protein
MLSVFGSTYSYEKLFSLMKNIRQRGCVILIYTWRDAWQITTAETKLDSE